MPCRVKGDTQKSLDKGKKMPTNGGKNKSANFGFTCNCIKFFKSGGYLHNIEVKNMSSRNPKVGNSTKERFFHFDLVIGKGARETKGTRASLKLGPSFLIHGENSAIGRP